MQKRWNCLVRGCAHGHSIGFSTNVLSRTLPTSNKIMFDLIRQFLESLRHAQSSSFVESVKRYIVTSLASGHCTVKSCAREHGASAGWLQQSAGTCHDAQKDSAQWPNTSIPKRPCFSAPGSRVDWSYEVAPGGRCRQMPHSRLAGSACQRQSASNHCGSPTRRAECCSEAAGGQCRRR